VTVEDNMSKMSRQGLSLSLKQAKKFFSMASLFSLVFTEMTAVG
jgi:hypothetical protein